MSLFQTCDSCQVRHAVPLTGCTPRSKLHPPQQIGPFEGRSPRSIDVLAGTLSLPRQRADPNKTVDVQSPSGVGACVRRVNSIAKSGHEIV